ncbi:MAG: tRNA pseudouridine(55) synthase TruB [Patescibacteria group bacterium]|nr:tRNA pseudouridine(55) synthase TruB [Patescibacteria group bacterium]
MELNKIKPGIYCIYKPKKISSYDVIRKLKKILGNKKYKIGHAGTLDVLACGLLIVAIGKDYTKKLNEFLNQEKEYIAEIFLGAESTTDDEDGKKTKIKFNKKPSLQDIKKVLRKFIGKIWQIPPIFSAIKIKGKPAYWYARRNKKINLEPRLIEIKDIKILKYQWPILKIKVICGKGVYIRSLARDIGKELKVGGYLKNLIRTRIGSFTLKQAIQLKP